MRKALFTATALTALSAAVAFAPSAALAQAGTPTAPGTAAATGGGAQVATAGQLRAKDLIDRDVYSTDGVEIGEIEDMIVDPAQGRITAVVVELETRLGFTERYISVPLDRLRLTPGERRVTLAMTRDEVRGVPGIAYRD
jgi:sporulation protein YlmC with PRC-barrel domain